MKYSNIIGVSDVESGWVPSPGFILRRAALLDLIRHFPPGKGLEIGCGPGGMLYEFCRLGFDMTGVELSEKSQNIAKKILAEFNDIKMYTKLEEFSDSDFDYLFSFEVLEHIQDDQKALTCWSKRLRPGAKVVCSVPAHTSKWNITDQAAGHYRRYDYTDLHALLENSNIAVESITTCGWPLSWFLEKTRLSVKSKQLKREGVSRDSITRGDIIRTMESGVNRAAEAKLFWLYGNSILGQPAWRLVLLCQKLFYTTHYGISFIVVGSKK